VLFIRGMLISKFLSSGKELTAFTNPARRKDQVPGGNLRCVITQEGAPSLTWRPPSLDHVFGHRPLRDLNAELKQLAVDTGRAP
jgi:hypothetical protein